MKKYLVYLSFLLVSILFIGINKVNALEDTHYELERTTYNDFAINHSVNDKYSFVINGYEYLIQYKSNGLYVNNTLISNSSNYLHGTWLIFGLNSNVYFYYFDSSYRLWIDKDTTNPSLPLTSSRYNYLITSSNCAAPSGYLFNFTNGNFVNSSSSSTYANDCNKRARITNDWLNFYGTNTIFTTKVYNMAVYDSSNIIYWKIIFPNLAPTIDIEVSRTIRDDFDYIVSKVLKITVSELDDNNYNYYYQFVGDNEELTNNWRQVTSEQFMENYTTYGTNKNGTFYFKIEDKGNNYITSTTFTVTGIDTTPRVNYTIEIDEDYSTSTKHVYNITLVYSNMTEEYYSVYYNLKDGTSKNLGYNVQNHVINYVYDNTIVVVYIYDSEDNLIDKTTIDTGLFDKDLSEPYIRIYTTDPINTNNTVTYSYYNTNNEDNKCYYQFGGDSEPTQESCSTENIITRHASYNTYFHVYITDNNDNIIDEKYLNLNLFENYPRLTFESYYSGATKSQVLNIYMIDYKDTDTLFYSYDNENWEQLTTQDLNTLYFDTNKIVYFKIYRNGDPICDAIYNVIVGNVSFSMSDSHTHEEIYNLTKKPSSYFKSFLDNVSKYIKEFSKMFTYLFNSLNPNIRAFLISIFTVFLICVIILIARGRR